MREKLINCYDSHTHFWATGQVAEGLKLDSLNSEDDVATIKIKSSHYRSNWLVGFGWNQNNWSSRKFPSFKSLDKVFPDTPVFFSRVDGHASWINTAAIQELKKKGFSFDSAIAGGVIDRDERGELTGLLFDQAHIKALLMLPDFSRAQHISFFKCSQRIFNQAGFTHVRDLSMHLKAWNMLREMENKKELTVCLDAFVTLEVVEQLEKVFEEIDIMRNDSSRQMRVHGVKFFIDGSLGSKTAYISENYLDTNTQGLLIWNFEDIKKALAATWKKGLQVAIHCIGDQAAYIAVKAAREISAEGILGRLHLEHVQLLSTETVQMMKPLHVTCHMQPCHWLSDHSWLKNSLSEKSIIKLFQWETLRKNKIPFFFGSDSPIEKPSLFDNKKALELSLKWGIPKLNADWKTYHQHSDSAWCPSLTEIENDEVKQVFFNGEPLI
jgi:predicted amidohydrolase YtcJ